MEDFEHTPEGSNASGIKDIEREMNISETGAKHSRAGTSEERTAPTPKFYENWHFKQQVQNKVFKLLVLNFKMLASSA